MLLAGRRVHLVDWARPTRGAPWVDTYLWALRLMDAGHTAAAAVDWACKVPAWHAGGTVDAQVSGGYLFRFKSGSGHLPPSVSPSEPSSHHSTAARPLTAGPVRPETHARM